MTRAGWIGLSVLLAALRARNAWAQSSTREVTTAKNKPTITIDIKLQPPSGAPFRRDSEGREIFVMSSCVDDEDASCFPPIKLRLDPESGELPGTTPVQMWLMSSDGSSAPQPVSVLPGHPAGKPHWQLGKEAAKYRIVQWTKAHPPSLRVADLTYLFRVSFDGGKGESVPFLLISLP